jgi:hypothetical protein
MNQCERSPSGLLRYGLSELYVGRSGEGAVSRTY